MISNIDDCDIKKFSSDEMGKTLSIVSEEKIQNKLQQPNHEDSDQVNLIDNSLINDIQSNPPGKDCEENKEKKIFAVYKESMSNFENTLASSIDLNFSEFGKKKIFTDISSGVSEQRESEQKVIAPISTTYTIQKDYQNEIKEKDLFHADCNLTDSRTPAITVDFIQIGQHEQRKHIINAALAQHEVPIDISMPVSLNQKPKQLNNTNHKNKKCKSENDVLSKFTPEIIADIIQFGTKEVEKAKINSILAKQKLPSFSESGNVQHQEKKVSYSLLLSPDLPDSLDGHVSSDPTMTLPTQSTISRFVKAQEAIVNSASAQLNNFTAECKQKSSENDKEIVGKPVFNNGTKKKEINKNEKKSQKKTSARKEKEKFDKINDLKADSPSVSTSCFRESCQQKNSEIDRQMAKNLVTKNEATKKENAINKDDNELQRRISSMRKQMSKVRSKLDDKKTALQKRANTVATCQNACIENDQLALWAMSMGAVRKPPSAVASLPNNSFASSPYAQCAPVAGKIPSMEFFQSTNMNKQKTRQQLENEVAILQSLVYQLAISNQVNKIQQGILPTPSFPTIPLPIPTNPQQELSNLLTVNALRLSKTSNSLNSEKVEGEKRRRNRGRKKKRQNISEKSDVDLGNRKLCKYINTIIKDYLKEKNPNCTEYEYKEDEDLEEYAQRCVRGDLGRIVEAEIRVNRRNNHQSFVAISNLDSSQRDGVIFKPIARSYAFDGDIVRAFVLHETTVSSSDATNQDENRKSSDKTLESIAGTIVVDEDEDEVNVSTSIVDEDEDGINIVDDLEVTTEIATESPKAFVIKIIKEVHSRQIVGTIKFESPKTINGEEYFILRPLDMRVQLIFIPTKGCKFFTTEKSNKKDINGFLFVAQVNKIQNGCYIGELLRPLGECGDIKAEISAVLIHNKIENIDPYEEKYNEMFYEPINITDKDLKEREDLRKICIFTIDPLTAKDLDDGVSCEILPDGTYEVGVHISDVSHYLIENTELDNLVKDRATSIYLVNDVIHMLPRTLCMKCSLLPGENRFAFSVFWKMNADGEVQSFTPRFTRTVINSCAQFAYEHVQKIIENPEEKFYENDFPSICNGFKLADIIKRIHILNKMAKAMRSRRYENGAISINNVKLRFLLDTLGEPCEFNVEDRLEANFLIEEFMLLANQSVARLIYEKFPQISILRNHSPPLPNGTRSLKEKLSKLGFEFDMGSSKSIYNSMQKIISASDDPEAMEVCLSQMLTKPMARAKYFCSGTTANEKALWHFALSIPIYTHFTSPIRRYADILVHRLLAAALNYNNPPQRTQEEMQEIAKNCNEQKLNAKNVGDETALLFFKRYIKLKKSIVLRAVVTDIFRNSLQAITIETGHNIVISYRKQNAIVESTTAPAFVMITEKGANKPPIRLQVFSTINVALSVVNGDIQAFFISQSKVEKKAKKIIKKQEKEKSMGTKMLQQKQY